MKLVKLLPIGVAALLLTACAEMGPKETLGTLGGAALGGWAGSSIGGGTGQLAAVAAGTLIGAFIGQEIGSSLDKADQLFAAQTAQNALEYQPSGTTSAWSNPDSGNSGTITPAPAYQTASGELCREYQTTITVGGEAQSGYGTACRQTDGSWQLVN